MASKQVTQQLDTAHIAQLQEQAAASAYLARTEEEDWFKTYWQQTAENEYAYVRRLLGLN